MLSCCAEDESTCSHVLHSVFLSSLHMPFVTRISNFPSLTLRGSGTGKIRGAGEKHLVVIDLVQDEANDKRFFNIPKRNIESFSPRTHLSPFRSPAAGRVSRLHLHFIFLLLCQQAPSFTTETVHTLSRSHTHSFTLTSSLRVAAYFTGDLCVQCCRVCLL